MQKNDFNKDYAKYAAFYEHGRFYIWRVQLNRPTTIIIIIIFYSLAQHKTNTNNSDSLILIRIL